MGISKDKKNILFIVTKSENGGAQRWVKEQIDILNDRFNTFIVTDEEGWLIQSAKMDGYFVDMKIHSLFSYSFLKKFAKYVKDNNIDLIVAGTANAGVYGRLVKIFVNKPVIYVSHGWSSIYNGGRMQFIYTRVEKFLSMISESVLCVSNSDYKRARDEISIEEEKLKLIVNKSMPIQKRDYAKRGERLKIVNVARFKHPKRQDLLIEAVKDLDVDLYLVGDGPSKKKCESNAPSNVHFLGEIDGFDSFYEYDLFALISDSEGLPLSGVEAMSAGLPLILSNVGGCPELIEGNGFLVDNKSEEIKEAIEKISQNLEHYSKNSVRLFDKKYNLLESRELYIDYYSKYIS